MSNVNNNSNVVMVEVQEEFGGNTYNTREEQ